MAQRRNELAGGLVAPAAAPETAVNDFLEMIAAGKPAHITAAHRTRDITAEQHRRELADLIDVVPLLPSPDPPPRDLRRCVERVEGVGGDTMAIALVPGDAEVPELQLLVLAHEHVEGREVAMQRLAAMERIERAEERRDFAAHEPLGLRATLREPRAHVAVPRVLHDHAITHPIAVDLGEAVEHAQRARLLLEQLGEVGFAKPGGETVADLDTDLRRQPPWGLGSPGTPRRIRPGRSGGPAGRSDRSRNCGPGLSSPCDLLAARPRGRQADESGSNRSEQFGQLERERLAGSRRAPHQAFRLDHG